MKLNKNKVYKPKKAFVLMFDFKAGKWVLMYSWNKSHYKLISEDEAETLLKLAEKHCFWVDCLEAEADITKICESCKRMRKDCRYDAKTILGIK